MSEDRKQINNEGITYLSILNSELGLINYAKKDDQKALAYLQDAFDYFAEQYNRVDVNQDTSGQIRNNLKRSMYDIRGKVIDILKRLAANKIQNKDFYGAIDYYKQAIYYNAKQGDLFYNLGKCLQKVEAHNSALVSLEKAKELAFDEDNDLYRMLGDIYIIHKKEPVKAIENYKKYLEKNQTEAHVYNQLGHCYESLDQFENIELQIEYFNKALELKPDLKSAAKNLCIVYPRLDKYDETLASFNKVLKLGANNDDYFDYACMLIKLGNFEEGWKYYEHRFQKETGPTPYPKIKKPKWKGQKIPGQTLLIHWEQGLGDTIFFARYLSLLKEFTDKLIFRVQPSMHELIKINFPYIQVIPDTVPVEDIKFDFHIPLMSLPAIFKTNVENIPLSEGFLKADKERSEFYKKEFFNNDCLKIGISWQGADVGNHLRDIPFETFYPLARLKNVKVYSFQKGIDTNIFRQMPPDVEIADLGSTFNNFNDTAGAMDNIDIFISSDNSVPNLAGAMGKKTVMLIHKNSEWRWLLDTEKTPWYDSFELIKKTNEKQEWSELIQEAIDKHLPQTVKK